jgi:tetratricopeptide (TPR) repeat protein
MVINMKLDKNSDINFREQLQNNLLKNPDDIKSLILLGALLFERFHEHENAITCLNKALIYDPNNVDAMFWLAMCFYHDFCEYDKAEDILKKALIINPMRSDCLSLIAYINWDKNKPLENSVAYLKKAIQYNPDWPMLHLELINLLFCLHKYKEARIELEAAIILLTQPVKTPNNEVERYYENVVTGRGLMNLEEKLIKAKLRIDAVEKIDSINPPGS